MKRSYNSKLKRTVYEIRAGQYYATSDLDIVLSTLLGSCVAVCLRDEANGVAGMNHFMLPGDVRRSNIITSPDAKYGIHAMELLINDMLKLGASRKNLKAKVFGGGRVLHSSLFNISETNVEFARAFLQMEGIPILAEDLAGFQGRKVLFFPDTGAVYLRRLPDRAAGSRLREERQYLRRLREQKESKDSNLTLF